MATYVKGDAVPNASGYELLEKVGENYNSLATANDINFEVSAMGFAVGDHLLAVKAKGDGTNYADSDPSNTVTYTVGVNAKTTEEIQNSLQMYTGKAAGSSGAMIDAITVPTTTVEDGAVAFAGSTDSVCLFSNLPMYAGSEVDVTIVPGSNANPNFTLGFEPDISLASWPDKSWSGVNDSVFIPESHIWMANSGNVSYLERGTKKFVASDPKVAVDVIYANSYRFKIKVLATGMEVYVNDARAFTTVDTGAYLNHTTTPVYFCFSTKTGVGVKIHSMKLVG